MKFNLLDSIPELERGERIVAVKAVSLAEEYLADHFPSFPVLPGVLMLEALIESAGWLVRDAQDFRHPVVLLRQARNVTYKSFVKPGNLLRLEVRCRRLDESESDFEGTGYCGSAEVVRARFGVRHLDLASRGQAEAELEDRLRSAAKDRFALLRP